MKNLTHTPPSVVKTNAAPPAPSVVQTIKFNASSLPVAASQKPVATAAKPIKVINLSQVQQKSLQEKLITNKFNQKVTTQLSGASKSIGNFYDQNNNCFGHSNTTATNNSNVKITKVVSSRSNANLIYLNKNSINTGNFISTFNQSQLINGSGAAIQQQQQQQHPSRQLLNNPVYLTNKNGAQPGCPTMRVLSSTNQFVTKSGIAGPTTLSNTKMPKFYASPKIITAQYFNSSPGTPIGNTAAAATNTSNHHINILNSNINRYLNQSKMNTAGTPSPCAANANSSVTINPRYLTNLNSPNGSSSFPSLANNSNINVNNTSNVANRVNDYSNYFVEQDEDVVVDEEEELGHAETYANYMPSKCMTTNNPMNND